MLQYPIALTEDTQGVKGRLRQAPTGGVITESYSLIIQGEVPTCFAGKLSCCKQTYFGRPWGVGSYKAHTYLPTRQILIILRLLQFSIVYVYTGVSVGRRPRGRQPTDRPGRPLLGGPPPGVCPAKV